MSAVLVRQSLSLARAEADRLSVEQSRQCSNELRSVAEVELLSQPNLAFESGAQASEMFAGARALSESGLVVAAGSTEQVGASGCVDGFSSAQQRILFRLPNSDRPTLSTLYASQSGSVRSGSVVEYGLDSVSRFQVWSDEPLDVLRLLSDGSAVDDTDGSGTQPGSSTYAGAAGIVGLVEPEATAPIGVSLQPVSGMSVSFTAPGDRRYRITSVLHPRNTGAAGEVLQQQILRNPGGIGQRTVQAGLVPLVNTSDAVSHELTVIDVPPAGVVSYRVDARFALAAGGNVSSLDAKPYLLVEDVGPADFDDPARGLPATGTGGLVGLSPDRYPDGSFTPPFGQFWQLPALSSSPTGTLAHVGPESGGAPMEVSFTPAAGRAYRVVSLVQLYAPGSPGAVVLHRVELDDGEAVSPVRSALTPLANQANAFSHQIEGVWVAPAEVSGPVTVRTLLGYEGPVGDVFNYTGAGLNPFLAVFDLGPLGATATPDVPAGLAGQVGADGFASGDLASGPPADASGLLASLTVPGGSERVLRVVSMVQPGSDVPSDVGVHRLRRGALTLQTALVAPANTTNVFASQMSALDRPSSAEATYETRVAFVSEQGSAVSLSGGFTPLLFVEDLGRLGAVEAQGLTTLAGAIYSPQGVRVFLDESGASRQMLGVQFGSQSPEPGRSPRHLQVISPGADPGPSLSENVSMYSNDLAASRLPNSTALGSPGRLSGRGTESVSLAQADQMRLDLAALVASVADRVALACSPSSTYSGLCLSAGQAISADQRASSRPAGVVGYGTPTAGVQADVPRGDQLGEVPGQSVSFVADGTRMYRVTSVVRVTSDLVGDVLDHRVVRGEVAVQAGLFPVERAEVPVPSTLVKFDVPPAGLVTYRSAARLATDPSGVAGPGVNVSSGAEGTTFLLVEDVGPAGGAEPPLDGAGGIVALQGPAAPTSGFLAGVLSPVSGQQVQFQSAGGRRYEVVSTVMPSSQEPSNTVRHVVGRVDANVSVLGEGLGRLGPTGSIGISQLFAVDSPPAGPVTYRSFLEFGAGTDQLSNSNWVALPSNRPALVVLDAGPQTPAASPPDFPAGILAASSSSSVQMTGRPGRLYRVESSATIDPSQLDLSAGDVVQVSLVRVVGASETVVQQSKVVADASGGLRTLQLVALDVPAPQDATTVSYQARFAIVPDDGSDPALFGAPSSVRMFIVDSGPAARVSGGTDFVLSGAASSVPTVPRSAGLARAAFAQAPQTVGPVVTVVDGQSVSLESDGNRRYRITSVLHPSSTLSDEVLRHEIVRGGGASTVSIQTTMTAVSNLENAFSSTLVTFDTPAAGPVSYGTRAAFAEQGLLQAGGAARGVIIVEDVGPALGGSIPSSGGAGLLADPGFASATGPAEFPAGTSAAVPGQQVTVELREGRRYLLESLIHPFSDSQTPGLAASTVMHRVIRVNPDGSESVVSSALLDLANPINPFGHRIGHTIAGNLTGMVTFRTELEFFNGAGGQLVATGFRPFIAVVDAGVVDNGGASPGTLPEGVLGVAGDTAPSGSVTEGTLLVVDVAELSLQLAGSRLYRVSSSAHPSYTDEADDFSPVAFTHQILRCVVSDTVGCTASSDFVPVQEGVGNLTDVGTTTAPPGESAPLEPVAYEHSLVAVDAPAAAPSTVVYRSRLLFPDGGSAQVSSVSEFGGQFTVNIPQLIVEDVGLAQERSDVYGFTPSTTPLELVGSAASAISSRAPADALSFRVEALAGNELTDPALQVSSCPTLACSEEEVTATFRVPQPESGLLVFDGPTTLSGHLSRPTTIIAGSISRPADLVVDVTMTLDAAVQLVATDRIVLDVPATPEGVQFGADLVALGLGPSSPASPFASTGSWTKMLSLSGSVAAPKVDLADAFSAQGPVRLVPRSQAGQAPWAVGFSRQWLPVSSRPATLSELRELFGD